MTVAQNLYLGDEKFFNRLRGTYIDAQQFLQSLNFPVDPTATVQSLGTAKRQMVEIARAVRLKAKIIIFDEPTATLTPEEKHHLFALDRPAAQGAGVDHLHQPRARGGARDLRPDHHPARRRPCRHRRRQDVHARDDHPPHGRAIADRRALRPRRATARRCGRPGDKVLSVQNLSMQNVVRNTSFSIFAGQVTGIFGLVGSGRTETAKIIAGVVKRDVFHGGDVRLEGRSVRYRTPRAAVGDGVVYVTEDRKGDGFFETMSVAENIYIGRDLEPRVARRRRRACSETRDARRAAGRRSSTFETLNGDARVIELSGGNQQKVVIAKALVQKPKLIIFDEPTRGVDVGAIAEIHHLIGALADEGLAVVVISSYLPEILSLSDRILVSRQGRIVEELSPDEATSEAVMFAAVY